MEKLRYVFQFLRNLEPGVSVEQIRAYFVIRQSALATWLKEAGVDGSMQPGISPVKPEGLRNTSEPICPLGEIAIMLRCRRENWPRRPGALLV